MKLCLGFKKLRNFTFKMAAVIWTQPLCLALRFPAFHVPLTSAFLSVPQVLWEERTPGSDYFHCSVVYITVWLPVFTNLQNNWPTFIDFLDVDIEPRRKKLLSYPNMQEWPTFDHYHDCNLHCCIFVSFSDYCSSTSLNSYIYIYNIHFRLIILYIVHRFTYWL